MSTSPNPSKGRVVLIVEDEPIVRMVATEYFRDAGYEVIEAAAGDEAIALLCGRHDVDALFTDVQMPGQPDGLELARVVRELSPSCAVVIVSGRVAPGPQDLVARAKFLAKPYDGDAAVRAVDQLLAGVPSR